MAAEQAPASGNAPPADVACVACVACGASDADPVRRHAYYRCPGCRARTCCLACYRAHSAGRADGATVVAQCPCGGTRDRTCYVPRGEYDMAQLLRDYRFLGDVASSAAAAKRGQARAERDGNGDVAPTAVAARGNRQRRTQRRARAARARPAGDSDGTATARDDSAADDVGGDNAGGDDAGEDDAGGDGDRTADERAGGDAASRASESPSSSKLSPSPSATRARRGTPSAASSASAADAASPTSLSKRFSLLLRAARQRGVTLEIMPAAFEKHRRNSSLYDVDKDVLYWRVEVVIVTERGDRTRDASTNWEAETSRGVAVGDGAAPAPRDDRATVALERCPDSRTVADIVAEALTRHAASSRRPCTAADTPDTDGADGCGSAAVARVHVRPDRRNVPFIALERAMHGTALASALRGAERIVEFPTLLVERRPMD